MVKYLEQHDGVSVSHNFVSTLWRENGLQPHRQGTFKVSRDPNFSTRVAEVVGLYLDPPAGAVVLSIDEKTQVQTLDRTQPVLPLTFGKKENVPTTTFATARRTFSPHWMSSPGKSSADVAPAVARKSSSPL